MTDETKTIELWPCGYDAHYNVRNCKANATTLARATDRQVDPSTKEPQWHT
jgi:hypothetical protein